MTRGLFALALLAAGPALAAASNSDICARADAEARLGDMTAQQCACVLSQGDRRMDSALARLWKEALLTGKSRVAEVRALNIPERRMERQMRRTLSDARKNCGVTNPFGM